MSPLLAQITFESLWQGVASPIFWVAFLGATGIWLMLPGEQRRGRRVGYMLAVMAAAYLIFSALPAFDTVRFSFAKSGGLFATGYIIFWLLTIAAAVSALAMCVIRNKAAGLVFIGISLIAAGIGAAAYGTQLLAAFLVVVLAIAATALVLFRTKRIEGDVGGALAAVALGLLATSVLPSLGDDDFARVANFWSLATLTLAAAVATISMRSPVYSAIWFALTLVGVAGLFLLQGAQFLSVATIAVYAGAILVTFLFVLMLAQPEGHDYYDRISWGWFPTAFASLAAALLIGGLAWQLTNLEGAPDTMAASADSLADGVLAESHVARFGGFLFSHHMVALEVTGALLMAALVGAISIIVQSKKTTSNESAATGEAANGGNHAG
ncbi:MAG: NADH-quinone oxidoreductase subunit J [bacterium]|nr:NADH-quinone oxidoreductase subunit J [bacterium]